MQANTPKMVRVRQWEVLLMEIKLRVLPMTAVKTLAMERCREA